MSMAFCSRDSISFCFIVKVLLFRTHRSSADRSRLAENAANMPQSLPVFFVKTLSARSLMHSR